MSGNSNENTCFNAGRKFKKPKPGDEIVISGISGRFPESGNMKLFEENLMNKKDLISGNDGRWNFDHPDLPPWGGKVPNLKKFDASFFGITKMQCDNMDPMSRMLLEHTYEALIDSATNPRELRGSNTGVFVGSCFSETENVLVYDNLQVDGLGIIGCSRSLLANRIAWWFGTNGPSFTIDTACSSALYALERAYAAMVDGRCDAAIVSGCNLCLHPHVSLQFARLGLLSPDGRCKVFDESANGYVRSEAVGTIFLQRAKDAKRIYAHLIHAKSNCDGFKQQGITFPSSRIQGLLLKELYEDCGIPASSLDYVEAHGTGTNVGDPEEMAALEQVFLKDRKTPLRVGSVKSNLGHTEPASAICSIAKVIIAMESGCIPPNLHYKNPRKDIAALHDGRVKIITEPTPWNGGYVGINSFGFGGANAHMLLKSHTKEKVNGGMPNDDLPRLVAVSGRTQEAVETLLNDLKSRPVDVEYVRLLHDICSFETPGHLYRGFTILPARGIAETPTASCQRYEEAKRPICFVFSGIGSQWSGMGATLMKLPVFFEAIKKCDTVLKPHGVDIFNILTNTDPNMYDNILYCFVGIAAVQIGLVDLLTSVGIVPDYIIGHSFGELSCAYADGCFTAEETILSAYFRGLASLETEVIYGAMADVGLGYKKLKDLCPNDIDIACHNGPNSSTISGPADSTKAFMAELKAKNILVEEVSCCNIPYHSRYIVPAGMKLRANLQKMIPNPKARSKKWLSSSVPVDKWMSPAVHLCSAEYQTNNLLGAVLFEEISKCIPEDAITIEIGPQELLQDILRESLPITITNIALTKRGHESDIEFVMQALGKLYEVGLCPQLQNLYPEVSYPVSRGTPMISPLIRWNHCDDHFVMTYKSLSKSTTGERTVEINQFNEEHGYMIGHVIDGRNLVPATGYLVMIWESLVSMDGQVYNDVPVVFENVKFLQAATIPKEGSINLTFVVQKGTGKFAVVDQDTAIVTGVVRRISNPSAERTDAIVDTTDIDESEKMSTRDIYKALGIRGYQYTGLFRGIRQANIAGTKGRISWVDNWAAFMDNMLQMKIIGTDTSELLVPTAIRKIVIDPKSHSNFIQKSSDGSPEIPIGYDSDYDAIIAGGIEIRGLRATSISRRKPRGEPVLEKSVFVAYRDQAELPLESIIRVAVHIALENRPVIQAKITEWIHESSNFKREDLASLFVQDVLGDLPLLQADLNVVAPPDTFATDELPPTIKVSASKIESNFTSEDNALIVITHSLLNSGNVELFKLLQSRIRDRGFLLLIEPLGGDYVLPIEENGGFNIILEKHTDKKSVILLCKKSVPTKIVSVIRVTNYNFSWLPELQQALKNETEKINNQDARILVLSEGDPQSGVVGLVNCLRQEPGGEYIRSLFIQDPKAPKFSFDETFYNDLLKLDLVHNVVQTGNVWGSYRFLTFDPLTPEPVNHSLLQQLIRGDLSSLKWVQGPGCRSSGAGSGVKIYYSALNFRDIMVATGKLGIESIAKTGSSDDGVIGIEYSGTDLANGRRVMGMIGAGALSTAISVDKCLQWDVPDNWTLEEAATVPVAYGTACYALYVSGKIKKGDKVLIHAGSGAVGQAAIALALHAGCEVFTTVGTQEKREFIKKNFPQIDDRHIGNSRDTSFETLILSETQGRGVDIVLNSLAEEKLLASLRCLTRGGRFLEIGKFDLGANNPIGMRTFLREVSYHGIHLDHLFNATTERQKSVTSLIANAIECGAVSPITRRNVFTRDQVETAFRFMAAGKHIGKLLIKFQDENDFSESIFPALPRYYCSSNCSYVIHGGLGGFGLELANWLTRRGARKLVLTSRKGVTSGYQRRYINLWKTRGIETLIISGQDAATQEGCEAILKGAIALGPIDAIFNLAVVLKDGFCENQTTESFEESIRVKAGATQQFDNLSRIYCPQLRHFVVFSSVSCGRGNAGQTNYGMANSIMERICETRVAEGLPAMAIEWGAIGDVGLVAQMQQDHKELVIGGTLQQGIHSCLQEMDGFMLRSSPIVASMVVAEKKSGSGGATNIVDAVINIMGLKNLDGVSHHTSLAELGMDSMMAVEIKQTLEREFDIILSPQDIRTLNFAKLIELSEPNQNAANDDKKKTVVDASTNGNVLLRQFSGNDFRSETYSSLATQQVDDTTQVFLLPGIEGMHTIFQTMCRDLKAPATFLSFDQPRSSSPQFEADYFLPHIKEKLRHQKNYVMVGFSYGCLVAIEIVRRLESEGLNGRLVLIDGAPEFLASLVKLHMTIGNDAQQQMDLLLLLSINNGVPIASKKIQELQAISGWDAKLELFLNEIPASYRDSFEPEQLRLILTRMYTRIQGALNYSESKLPRIKAPITFLRANHDAAMMTSHNYGLEAVTEGEIVTHVIDRDHQTILEDSACAAAVNGDLNDTDRLKTQIMEGNDILSRVETNDRKRG